MADYPTWTSRSRPLKPLAQIGGRAAAAALRPVAGAVGAVAEMGVDLERRAVDRLLDSGDVERLLADSRLQAIVSQVVESEGAAQVIDKFFGSRLFDRLVDGLLASDGLWRLVDEVAASPAVRAAVSQQGLGFADQLGNAVRARSRRGDRRLERAAGRLAGHPTAVSEQTPVQTPVQSDGDGQRTSSLPTPDDPVR